MWKRLYKKESRERKANKEIQGRKKLKRKNKKGEKGQSNKGKSRIKHMI